MTTTIRGTDNTAAAPALTGTDTDTGIFFPAADTIAFAEGGVESMRITPDQQLLIGTSSAPGGVGTNTKLVTYANANSDNNIWIRNDSDTASSSASLIVNAAGNSWRIGMGSSTKNSNALDFEVDVSAPNSKFRMTTAGNFSAVIPSGSTLYPSFWNRAWVNFNGTGVVAIRASGNVSSITDNGTGDYTVNLSTAMPDANYSILATTSQNFGVRQSGMGLPNSIFSSATESAPTTSAFRVLTTDTAGAFDSKYVYCGIFR